MTLKIGIIGTNFISDDFCDAAAQVDGIELYAVYSRSADTGNHFAERHNIPTVFTDYEQFLDSPIDAVYVASPNFAHCSQSIKAMEKKKHVLCEKVMASNEQEALSMIECAKKNHVVLLEAMRPDFDPAFDMIKNALPRIGKIRRASFEFCQYSSRYDRFKDGIIENAFKRELSNGALMDIGVYTIYPMVALFGKPASIKADAYMLKTGVDGEGSIVFNYDEMMGAVQYSKISNSYIPSEIQGEEGSIIIEQINSFNKIIIRYRDGREEVISNEQFEKESMFYEVEEFIKIIKEGKRESEINSHENSIHTIEIMDEVRKQIGLVYLAD